MEVHVGNIIRYSQEVSRGPQDLTFCTAVLKRIARTETEKEGGGSETQCSFNQDVKLGLQARASRCNVFFM